MSAFVTRTSEKGTHEPYTRCQWRSTARAQRAVRMGRFALEDFSC